MKRKSCRLVVERAAVSQHGLVYV